MGADITLLNETKEGEPTADLLIRSSSLHGTTVEGAIIPTLIDELPMIAVMAAFAEGTTVIRDAAELRVKESDRIQVMTENLQKMGADIQATDDGMIINGGKPLHGAEIDSHLDHRVAMSFAVAGLLCDGPLMIRNGEMCQYLLSWSFIPIFTAWLNNICKVYPFSSSLPLFKLIKP